MITSSYLYVYESSNICRTVNRDATPNFGGDADVR